MAVPLLLSLGMDSTKVYSYYRTVLCYEYNTVGE